MGGVTSRCTAAPAGGSGLASGPPTSGALRWLRGAVVGLAATGVAGAGHLTAGGGLPSGTALAPLTLVAVAAGVGLSNRRWTAIPLMTMLLGAQVVFHVAFGGMGHPQMSHPMSQAVSQGTAGVTNHLGPSSVDSAGGLQTGGSAAGMVMTGHTGATMLAAHLLAALVTALLLRRGEDWCWRLLDLMTRPVRGAALRSPLLPVFPKIVVASSDVGAAPLARLLRDVAPRRGPPLASIG
jgi:hypothetical protein